jgi:hypothetical protein
MHCRENVRVVSERLCERSSFLYADSKLPENFHHPGILGLGDQGCQRAYKRQPGIHKVGKLAEEQVHVALTDLAKSLDGKSLPGRLRLMFGDREWVISHFTQPVYGRLLTFGFE